MLIASGFRSRHYIMFSIPYMLSEIVIYDFHTKEKKTTLSQSQDSNALSCCYYYQVNFKTQDVKATKMCPIIFFLRHRSHCSALCSRHCWVYSLDESHLPAGTRFREGPTRAGGSGREGCDSRPSGTRRTRMRSGACTPGMSSVDLFFAGEKAESLLLSTGQQPQVPAKRGSAGAVWQSCGVPYNWWNRALSTLSSTQSGFGRT